MSIIPLLAINLADERIGAKVLFANDEFFAEKENLLKSGRGVFIADKYTDHGKWMDGWETRRRRTPGNDLCVIALAGRGTIHAVDIDTNHFLGNHPPFASIDGCCSTDSPDKSTQWSEVLPKSKLEPGKQNIFKIKNEELFTHLRLNIYPDGGIARLKVYGDLFVDLFVNWNEENSNSLYDLVAIENGGKVITCNDMFFSSKDNLIMPGRGKNMGDGWETKRKREPGNDWAILKTGTSGNVKRIEVDTAHFKGNYPESCSIEGVYVSNFDNNDYDKLKWKPLLPQSKLSADTQHFFEKEVNEIGKINLIRLNIFPDGGISRLRLYGVKSE